MNVHRKCLLADSRKEASTRHNRWTSWIWPASWEIIRARSGFQIEGTACCVSTLINANKGSTILEVSCYHGSKVMQDYCSHNFTATFWRSSAMQHLAFRSRWWWNITNIINKGGSPLGSCIRQAKQETLKMQSGQTFEAELQLNLQSCTVVLAPRLH